MPIIQLDSELGGREGFDDRALYFDLLFLLSHSALREAAHQLPKIVATQQIIDLRLSPSPCAGDVSTF
jgi:hypothetical protein